MATKAGLVMMMAAVLTGCGAAPVGAPERPSEQRVSGKKAAAKAAAAKALIPGPGSALGAKAAAAKGGTPTAPKPGATKPSAAGASAAGAPVAAVGVAAAEAAAAVAILEAPTMEVRAVTSRDLFGTLVGADFAPEGGRLAWQLRAPESGLLVSKVKVVFQGAGDPVTVEATPAELEMSPELRAETRLVVPFALIEILGVIGASPVNADVTATATFYDAQGQAIHGVNGKPLALSTTINVM